MRVPPADAGAYAAQATAATLAERTWNEGLAGRTQGEGG
jgi:hypothetical protein